jgi:CHAT domain-containing protein
VYLAADSALNLVPFDVLVDAQGHYLAETYQFNYVSSGRDISQFGAASAAGTGVVILADPDYDVAPAGGETRRPVASGPQTTTVMQEPWKRLRGTQQEAAAVVQELTGEVVQVYPGVKATAEVVKGLRSPRILHLATHGFFLDLQGPLPWRHNAHGALALQTDASSPGLDEAAMAFANPLVRSGIVLAGANHLGHTLPEAHGNDGILTALEIAGLSLWGTDLVVLSACETGVGDTRRGEGVFGLRRAFQLAGAQTVVMSLWEVPDTTTVALMTDFYHALHAGVGKARALHTAALAQLQRRRQQLGAAHPFYWGAFIAVGDPGKL